MFSNMLSRILILLGLVLSLASTNLSAQSIELMPASRGIQLDVQWFKTLDTSYRWSILNRSLAFISYDGTPDLFSGTYLNYTTKSGFGGTLVGRIGSSSSGGNIGVHFLKGGKNWSVFSFATAGIGTDRAMEYNIFAVFQFRPKLSKTVNLYTSAEAFSVFNNTGHGYSIQRLRLGIDWKTWQIGFASDFSEFGTQLQFFTVNIGGFLRREF